MLISYVTWIIKINLKYHSGNKGRKGKVDVAPSKVRAGFDQKTVYKTKRPLLNHLEMSSSFLHNGGNYHGWELFLEFIYYHDVADQGFRDREMSFSLSPFFFLT